MASEIKVDTISEKTSTNGVTIDSVSLKDGKVATANSIDSDAYVDGSIDNAHIADDAIDSEHYAAGSIDTAHIADDQITLAKMAGGTDGNIISYDASGDPVAIATGSDGQVLTSTGAGSPPAFEAAGGGAWNKLQKQTASGAALVEFDTTYITSAYKLYKIILNNGKCVDDGVAMYVQFKHGGAYQTSGYEWAHDHVKFLDGGTGSNYTGSGPQIRLPRESMGNASGEHFNFEFTLFDPLATDNTKIIMFTGCYKDSAANSAYGFGGGSSQVITAIDAVKFYMASGNLSGDFTLYGVTT